MSAVKVNCPYCEHELDSDRGSFRPCSNCGGVVIIAIHCKKNEKGEWTFHPQTQTQEQWIEERGVPAGWAQSDFH